MLYFHTLMFARWRFSGTLPFDEKTVPEFRGHSLFAKKPSPIFGDIASGFLVSCESGQKPGRQNWANTTWVWTWMGPLNHVVDRDRESHSREWDLRILCPPPLEQWTRPVCAYAWHSTLPTATCYRWLNCYQQWLQYRTMTSLECRQPHTAVERHRGSEM